MPSTVARVYVAVYALSIVLYPLWFPLSGKPPLAAARFVLACAGLIGLLLYLRKNLAARDPLPGELLRLPSDKVLWALAAVLILTRVYPLTLPIHYASGGDEEVHMGFPALPFKAWSRQTELPHTLAAWLALAFFFALRRPLAAAAAALRGLKPWAVLSAAALAAGYFMLVSGVIQSFIANGYATLVRDLVRFPPLPHFILMLVYSFLGISNWSGRLPEFFFFIAAGVVLYKLVAEFRSKNAARLAAALFWFMPVFSYFSMRGSQTNGEHFFFLSTAYLFALWTKHRKDSLIYWTALAVVAGSLYRYSLPLAAVVSAVAGVWVVLTDPERRPWPGLSALSHCAGMFALTVVPWVLAAGGQRPYGIRYEGVTWATSLLSPITLLPGAVSWPAAALMGLGLLLALARPKDGLQKYLLAWVAVYYAFMAMDVSEDVRLDLPMYLPLIICAADGLFVLAGERLGRWAAAGLAAYCLAASTWMAASPVRAPYNLRSSLQLEYLPLDEAASEIGRLPEGTRLLGVDLSAGNVNFYLNRPRAVRWTVVYSRNFKSLEELRALCRAQDIDVVIFALGTFEALTFSNNENLFNEFERGAPWLKPRARFSLGRNKILFQDVLK